MNRNIPRCPAIALLIVIMILQGFSPLFAQTTYPNKGSLYYDGVNFFQTLFRWTAHPGSAWSVESPGYEHDLAFDPKFLKDCIILFNLLPGIGYDDCPTAGWSEERKDQWVFSFGTFNANQIYGGELVKLWYAGQWIFETGGPLKETSFTLRGQEVRMRPYCPLPPIWCMIGTISANNKELMTGTLKKGSTFGKEWSKE